jgi:hypothetical protein
MPFSLMVLVGGIAVALLVFLVTGGHVLFLPLLLIFPLGVLSLGRRRRRW